MPGYSGPAAVFTVTGTARPFVIDVRFLGIPTADLRDAYIAGAMRWMDVIVGDLPDAQFNSPNSVDCFGNGSIVIPPTNEVIDDVVIYAKIGTIDGPSNVIARATACFNTSSERPGSRLTILGGMGYFWGPVVGAATLILLNQQITSYTEYWPFVLGVILLILLFLFPGGIVGGIVAGFARLAAWKGRRVDA